VGDDPHTPDVGFADGGRGVCCILRRVGRRTLPLAGTVGALGVFLLFGSLTLVALLYFWREVPETKARSLQEIERDLAGRGVG
jgi:hypothetical protein